MEPFLVVSPHLDDAVLSAGQFMASWPGAHVLTIFCGRPADDQLTTFDARCGFLGSDDAMTRRQHEDDRALRTVAARPIRAAFLDRQYGAAPPATETIAEAIVAAAEAIDAWRVAGPVGLLHPDHQRVAEAVRLVKLLRPGWQVMVYEELPARVTDPAEVAAALTAFGIDMHRDVPEFIGAGLAEQKEQAVRCYGSQIWALNMHAVLVEERFWRLECTD